MIDYCLKHTKRFSLLSLLIAFFFLLTATAFAAMSYGSGTYTNLCGSDYNATFHSCSGECNPSTGSCASKTGNTVVKYTCDGRRTECRDNESAFSTYHSLSGVACGKTVQIDVFNKNCRDGEGNWTCGNNSLTDYIVWYSGDCSTTTPSNPLPQSSCQDYQPIDTQFRQSGTSVWVGGSTITANTYQPGSRIDVNCFAKNGSALLPGARILVKEPNGTERVISNSASAYRYEIKQAGTHEFRCESTTLNACSNTDSFSAIASPPASCNQTCSATQACQDGLTCSNGKCRNPQCTKESSCGCQDTYQAACEDLTVVSGNNERIPTKVTLRARASDNQGNIQKYRFFFGDGTQTESDSAEVQHTYEISGYFIARVDVKNSKGVWITGDQCESRVTVKPARLETHKLDCSDVFITSGNHEKAPITAKFKVTGYDNKGDIKKYKLDFGNGVEKEADGNEFEQVYNQSGTYTIKGYVQDSAGNWKGGEDDCKTTLYIETARVTKQPDTGTPTNLTIAAIFSGVLGSVLLMRRYALLHR